MLNECTVKMSDLLKSSFSCDLLGTQVDVLLFHALYLFSKCT